MRAFIRPGVLQTAQDVIAACSEIFTEMEMLIEEGRKGLGKFILPFKDWKIQLLIGEAGELEEHAAVIAACAAICFQR